MAEIVVKLVNGELAGKTAQTIAKEVTAATLAYKKATIGTKEWVEASKKLDDIKEVQEDLAKQQKALASGSDVLKKAWNNLPGAGYFNQITDSFGMMKQGVGGLGSQFGVLKSAIAATGFGLILIAVMAIIAAFKTFTPIVDKVEQVLGGISGVIQELTNRFQNLGAGLWKIITGAPGGVDQLASSFDGLSESIKGAYEEGVRLAEMQQDLDDRNRGIAISNAEAEASINRLIIQSKNRTATEADRLNLLNDAEKVAIANFEKENQLAKDNYELAIRQAKQKSKLSEEEILQLAAGTLSQEIEYEKRGTLDDDLLQKITENRVTVIGLEGKNNVLLEKINNQRDKLREANEEKEKKAAEARAKRLEKEQADLKKAQEEQEKYWKDYYDALRGLEEHRIQMMDDSREKDLTAAKFNIQKQIEAIDANAPLYAERIAALTEAGAKQRDAINTKWNKIDQDKRKKWIDDELKFIEEGADNDRLILLEKLANRQIDEEDFNTNAFDIQMQVYDEQLTMLEQQGLKETELYKSIKAQQLQAQVDHNKQIQASNEQLASATIGAANSLADAMKANSQSQIDEQQAKTDRAKELYGEESVAYKQQQLELLRIQKEQGEKKKRIERAQIGINLVAEIANIWKGAASLGPIAGPIIGAVLTGAAVIRAGIAYKNIDKEKFARGGKIKGKPHSQGGVPFTVDGEPGFEAEGDEVLINKRSARLFSRQLSAINSYNGYGVKFETGGPVNPWKDRSRSPMPSGKASNSSSDNDANLTAIRQNIEGLRQDIQEHTRATDQRFDRIECVVFLSDVEKGLATKGRIKAEADL